MKAKAMVVGMALGVSALFTGCDDDKINYAFSSDAGLFFFSFGNTVCGKSSVQGGGTTISSDQSQPTNTQAQSAAATSSSSDTNSFQRLTHAFELLTFTPTLESSTTPFTQGGSSNTRQE